MNTEQPKTPFQRDPDRVFTYHEPTEEKAPKYVAIRAKARELDDLVRELAPPGREQSLALTKIEEATMWANAAIARND